LHSFEIVLRRQRWTNFAAVVLPFVGFLVAVATLWGRAVSAVDLALLAGFYVLGGIGVTVGFHRLLTHRSFATHKPIEYTLAFLGSLAVQGPVIDWVADHRKHHAFADAPGDPHSPHAGEGRGLRGLWHAHVGWLFSQQGRAAKRRYARDLLDDAGMRAINRRFPQIVGASLLLPALLGGLISGEPGGALTGALWGGLVRIFLQHHATWSVNSLCHYFGARRFATDDESRNVFWLALPSLGESWHHNHHAFPRSARHGLRWWELDPSGLVIGLLERLGLAWNVVRIHPDRQAARTA
jgi:stearoyl-CoA desaturase (Delta-9 desaturase)